MRLENFARLSIVVNGTTGSLIIDHDPICGWVPTHLALWVSASHWPRKGVWERRMLLLEAVKLHLTVQ